MLRVVRREFGSPRYVMIAGLGDAALRLGREIENASAYGVRLTGFLAESGQTGEVELDRNLSSAPAFRASRSV